MKFKCKNCGMVTTVYRYGKKYEIQEIEKCPWCKNKNSWSKKQ